jgi:YVTN family beta-propeller protein
MIRKIAAVGLFGLGMLTAARAEAPRLLVLNKADDTLSIIDPETRRTVATVPTGHGPHEVIVIDGGKTAIVANYGDQTPGNSLSVIDLEGGMERERVDLGPLLRPHGLVEVDGNVYFTAEMNRAIGRYNPAEKKVDRVVGFGQEATHMLAAGPDGRMLYTANIGSGTVSVLDRQTGRLEHIAVGAEPEGIAASPDGRFVWVGHRIDGLVTVVDTATRKVVETLRIGDVAIRVQVTPDGKLALVSDPVRGDLVAIDTETRKEVQRVAVGQAPVGILIVPGGEKAFVALAGEDAVVEIALPSLEVKGRIESGKGPDGLAWAVQG